MRRLMRGDDGSQKRGFDMRTRNHDWFDTKKLVPVYGVQAFHDGKWKHAAINGKPILCATKKERDAARALFKQAAIAKATKE